MQMNTRLAFYWIARIIAAVIMIQTLYFKFTAAPESVYIFTTVGMEPWGRIGIGVLELVASFLILVTATAWLGAGLAAGMMAGAIGMHITLLGINVQEDGGQLFLYAVAVLISSLYILWYDQSKLKIVLARVSRRSMPTQP
jgi:putative oxidoreductase